MKKINISEKEYKILKKKAEVGNSLLVKLVKGLEDIKNNRVKPWKKTISG